jgi:hypothetical protein
MVVKTFDGTEHTIKWTDKTTMEGVEGVKGGEGVAEGTKGSVEYTEKTAVGQRSQPKPTADAVK